MIPAIQSHDPILVSHPKNAAGPAETARPAEDVVELGAKAEAPLTYSSKGRLDMAPPLLARPLADHIQALQGRIRERVADRPKSA
jgi:hypothetical protein